MAKVSTLNVLSNSPKFCNNFHPPVSNVHRFYASTKYVVVNKASRYCFIFEWVNKLLRFSLRSVQSVVLWILRKKRYLIQIRIIRSVAGSRNRKILVLLGEVPWGKCLQRARLIQIGLNLCSVKIGTITPFRTFVASPIEELYFSRFSRIFKKVN